MIAATLGWAGMLGTLGAYLMLTRGRLASTSLTYGLINVAGGAFAGAAAIMYGAWPNAASGLIWAAVAAHASFPLLRARLQPALAGSR